MPTFRNKPVDVVLDVRSRLEFFFGHLPSARCIPLPALEAECARRPELSPDRRVLVYCASGARSAMAAQLLRRLGFRHVVDGGALATARQAFTP